MDEEIKSFDNEINRETQVHTAVLTKYDSEWERTHDIENKATNLVGFVGIIFAIEVIGFSELNNISHFEIALVGSSLTFLFLTIVFCLLALEVKSWDAGLKLKPFMENYAGDASKDQVEILKKLSIRYAESALTNSRVNNQISNNLRWAYYTFAASVTFTIIYLIYTLILSW